MICFFSIFFSVPAYLTPWFYNEDVAGNGFCF